MNKFTIFIAVLYFACAMATPLRKSHHHHNNLGDNDVLAQQIAGYVTQYLQNQATKASEPAGGALGGLAGAIPNAIGGLTGALPGAIGGLTGALPGAIGSIAGALPNPIGGLAGGLPGAISGGLTGGLPGALVGGLSGALPSVASAISGDANSDQMQSLDALTNNVDKQKLIDYIIKNYNKEVREALNKKNKVDKHALIMEILEECDIFDDDDDYWYDD